MLWGSKNLYITHKVLFQVCRCFIYKCKHTWWGLQVFKCNMTWKRVVHGFWRGFLLNPSHAFVIQSELMNQDKCAWANFFRNTLLWFCIFTVLNFLGFYSWLLVPAILLVCFVLFCFIKWVTFKNLFFLFCLCLFVLMEVSCGSSL